MRTFPELLDALRSAAPDIESSWDAHLKWWKGEPAGNYNDIAVFAHHAVAAMQHGRVNVVEAMFNIVEKYLTSGDQEVKELLIIGFIEEVQNIALNRIGSLDAFLRYLGPQSRDAWAEVESGWEGKSSLADVIRAERKREKKS